jgi:hypothetical protein
MKTFFAGLFLLATITCAVAQTPDAPSASRIKTREQLRTLLDKVGPEIKVTFRQSEKQPFNFVGLMKGLTYADSFEIVIGVTNNETIGFRIFPHYKGGYINVDKVKDGPGLMKQLLNLSDRAFLFWGADKSGDVFCGYTFTLESGFPEAAMKIVLNSIMNHDKFIGEMRVAIDGSVVP